MSFSGKRILVTGGAGFIGSHLVDQILEDPDVARVCVLDNLVNGSRDNLPALEQDPRLVLLSEDILDTDAVDEAVSGTHVVFNLACLGVRHSLHSPLENHRVNAEGTLNVLLAAQRQGVERFVHVSSSEVFGTAQHAPIDESHPTWPETVYGGSKLAGEAYARAFFSTYGLPVVVARPFNTYGPRSHFEGDCGEVIPRTVVRVLCGLPPIIFGDGEQTRDFLHVSDTARGLRSIAGCEAAVGRTVNFGFGRETTINALCRRVADAAGRPDLAADHVEARPGDVRRLWVDNTLVRELIGFEPRMSLADGITDLVGEFQRLPSTPEEMLARMADRNWEGVA